MRKTSMAVLCAMMAGCAAGPDFVAPSPQVPASFTRTATAGHAAANSTSALRPQWWKDYGSPALDALVERALARNPTVDAAVASLKAAQENVNAQRGLFYPTVQAGYGLGRQGTGNVLSSPLASGNTPYTLHTAQLSVGFVPDVFGANQRMVESLQAQSDSQRYQLDALRVTLASNVVAAVLQQAVLAEQLRVVEDTVDVTQRQVTHLRRLQSSGYASGIDLASQEQAHAQALALLPPLRKQIEQTRDLIAILCGDLPDAAPAGVGLTALTLPASLPSALPSQLVAQRPDVQAALAQAHASHALVGVASANLLPQFSLTAGLGFNADALAGLLSRGNLAWGLGAGLSQTLFAGGALQARKRGAEAVAEASLAQYRSTVLAAFQNVADTLYAIDADHQALRANQDAEKASERVLAMTQKQFDQGYASGLALLGVRQNVLQARLARVAAYGSYLGDTVALYQALGGGWTPPASLVP